MFELSFAFLVAAFFAGVFMFFAPCTFPLVPAFLAFISGVDDSSTSLNKTNGLVRNAIAFCFGFSLVFISVGILAGLAGELIGSMQGWLIKIGGLIVIFFGLVMMNIINLNKFFSSKSLVIPKIFTPGNVSSSALVGASFAFGWTPCVGPILASILLLATTQGEILTGGVLLTIFSLGLSIPFVLTALFYDRVKGKFSKWSKFSVWLMRIGGFFTVIFGLLLFFESFGLMVGFGTTVFMFLGLDFIFDLL